jgi:hypothetical protein
MVMSRFRRDGSRSMSRSIIVVITAAGLAGLVAPTTTAAPASCRVRNVTQDAAGSSLIRMVERAVDGDRLRVRGTCPGTIVIGSDIVIRGVGVMPTLTGMGERRVVRILAPARVTLRGLTVERGHIGLSRNDCSGKGAGIENRGDLTVVDTILRENVACNGGGISNDGALALVRAIVRGNRASLGGGLVNWADASIDGSLIKRNDALHGGGLANAGAMLLAGTSVTRNAAEDDGGGITNSGHLTLTASVVKANTASVTAGGICNFISGSTLVIDASSTVEDNDPNDIVDSGEC